MAEESNMYNRLLRLPLFQGMSKGDLEQMVAHTKMGFHKYADGECVAREGERCLQLLFLLKGRLEVVAEADDHGYTLYEQMAAPDIVQPDRIFGLTQSYSHSFLASNTCHVLSIGKADILVIANKFEIFRLNLLNIISTLSQRQSHAPWRPSPTTLEGKITRFIENHCMRPAGEKHLAIKMTRLAQELNDSRLDVSRALHQLQDKKLILLSRGYIHIPAFEKLLTH